MSWARLAPARCAAVLALGFAVFASRAEACMVCIPLPQATAVDHLLGAETVVLARENPDRPFSHVATEVLKGEIDAPGIDLFLDSTTRRRLALNPDRSVVLVFGVAGTPAGSSLWHRRSPDTDAESGGWRSLGYASPRYEALIREILARSPLWDRIPGRDDRAAFLIPYLADVERPIRELAYLEVGQASYDTIRKADPFVSAGQLQAFLGDPKYLEWRALYVLLLGVDATAEEAKAVHRAMAGFARFDTTRNLSAWATALIEVDGDAALDWLETEYLGAPDRDPDAVAEVVKALSVHGARAGSGLRERIVQSYGVLIQTHPSLAGWAARDLTAWHDWRFAEALEAARESGVPMDGATRYAIDYHLARARAFRGELPKLRVNRIT